MDIKEKNKFFKNYNTWLNGDELRIGNLQVSRVVPEFINSINRLVKNIMARVMTVYLQKSLNHKLLKNF